MVFLLIIVIQEDIHHKVILKPLQMEIGPLMLDNLDTLVDPDEFIRNKQSIGISFEVGFRTTMDWVI